MDYKFNKFQTPLTDELLNSLPKEVRNDLFDTLETIKFVQWLVSPEEVRGFAKNKQRWDNPNDLDGRKEDPNGRIYVDLTKPHILENVDFFRERAIFFEKNKTYTHIPVNPNPKSAYALFWKEEVRRWKEGLVRPSDGEWITGYHYFYLNYVYMWINEEDDATNSTKKKKVRGTRKREFPDFWLGDYIWFHYMEQARENGEHCKLLKKRGSGFSWKFGGITPCTMYTQPGLPNFHLASDKGYLLGDRGVFGKVVDVLDWIAKTTPLPKLRLVDKPLEKNIGYKDVDGVRKGLLSSVEGISLKDDPDKARGLRGPIIQYEEDGVFDNLEDAWNVNLEATEDGGIVFGTQIAGGTGGTEGANFIGSEKLFYNPEAYSIYGLPNVFDRNTSGNTKCGFFWGAYLNRSRCYDKSSGEPDVIKALIEVLTKRDTIKKTSPDTKALTQKKAEQPITPQDAVMRIEGSVFPTGDLKEYLADISPNLQNFVSSHYIGDIIYNAQGELIFKFDDNKTPIRDFPLENCLNKEGAIEIYELPQRGSDDRISHLRYIAGCLTPGEKVLTNYGLKSVEEVDLNDKLINENGNIVDIHKLLKYDVKNEDVYKVKVSNTFRTTNFTKEHPLLVSKHRLGYISSKKCHRLGISQRYHKFDFNYKKVEDVEVGNWIKVPNIYNKELDINLDDYWINNGYRIDRHVDNPLYNKEFWWFVGLWLGDGWCENNGYNISIALNISEPIYLDRLERLINNLFGREFYKRQREGGIELTFGFQQLSSFMTNNFRKYAYGKRIPEWIKYLNKEFKIALLQGYLDSDGCVTSQREYYSTEFVSINLELLESFQDILFSLGIVSGLGKLRKSGNHILKGRYIEVKECYHLRMAHIDTINFARMINDYDDHKIKRIDFNNLKDTRRRPHDTCFLSDDGKYIYFRIMNIEKSSYSGIVYNFECETHTFMCHHITTHNCDPVDDDTSTTNSLPSIFILDRFTDRIVTEYTGRPRTAVEFYDICIRLLEFYNATLNYENDKKGLFSYFSNKQKLHLLCETPKILKDKQLIRDTALYGNKMYGTNSGKAVNAWGRRLQADWLVQPAYGEEETGKLNMHKIRSIGYLKELIAWNPDINADRVSAMGMLMIYREDLAKFEIRQFSKKVKTKAHSEFFSRNQKFPNFGYSMT